ncbi:inactive pancreatic lipase-related protein 1-like [Engystomops pustulosus]|uniref:inactive pancreatic lipase-related protein 1-like n=1 Tax=Engystomops pustulosus TaxID=76066 RepID=UPI003AFA88EB
MSCKMLRSCVLILSLLGAATGLSICYAPDECYSLSPPFSGTAVRPFAALPLPVPVYFYLYTPSHPDEYEEIFPDNLCSSGFNFNRKTRIVCHGFTENGKEPWIRDMCQEFSKHDADNCIAVDWSAASSMVYVQAANSVRTVATSIANLLEVLEVTYGYSSACHLIGHSLGAHVMGFVGKYRKNIFRITGLDTAAPYFEGAGDDVGLSRNDATFVDTIHTSALPLANLGLGFINPVGDIDFYPNGGGIMPECPDVTAIQHQVACMLPALFGPYSCSEDFLAMFEGCEELVKDVTITATELKEKLKLVFCHHYQAIYYFIDSINNYEKYKACPCRSLETCRQGISEPCSEDEVQYMGYRAKPPLSQEWHMYTLSTA